MTKKELLEAVREKPRSIDDLIVNRSETKPEIMMLALELGDFVVLQKFGNATISITPKGAEALPNLPD